MRARKRGEDGVMRDVIGNPLIVNRISRNDDRLLVHVKNGGGDEKVYTKAQRRDE
jgi:hypothetical protein